MIVNELILYSSLIVDIDTFPIYPHCAHLKVYFKYITTKMNRYKITLYCLTIEVIKIQLSVELPNG